MTPTSTSGKSSVKEGLAIPGSVETREDARPEGPLSAGHGNCPHCNADLNGGSIWEHFREELGSEAGATRVAAMYGATKTQGRWGRQIALYDFGLDRTTAYRCPDCAGEWERAK
ncbi:MAG TPA: hypothetical protein VIO94_15875 [Phenylobacterium sp.]